MTFLSLGRSQGIACVPEEAFLHKAEGDLTVIVAGMLALRLSSSPSDWGKGWSRESSYPGSHRSGEVGTDLRPAVLPGAGSWRAIRLQGREPRGAGLGWGWSFALLCRGAGFGEAEGEAVASEAAPRPKGTNPAQGFRRDPPI